MPERMVTLPAPLVIGMTQKLVELARFATVAWLIAAGLNVWMAFRVGGWWWLALLPIAGMCCFSAWGGVLVQREAQRLRDDLARQAGLIT